MRKDKFIRQALRIYRTLSSPTLCQRLDAGANHPDWSSIVAEKSITLLQALQVMAAVSSQLLLHIYFCTLFCSHYEIRLLQSMNKTIPHPGSAGRGIVGVIYIFNYYFENK